MTELKKIGIFANNLSTLKETSKDNSNKNKNEFMTESELEVVNFDRVKTKYANTLGLSEEAARSVDALTSIGGVKTLIEFKNGCMDTEKSKVRDKVRDSLLLLCDIVGCSICDTRENYNFILVYNEDKNYKARISIAQNVSNKAGERLILHGLERFEKLYFKKVITCTEKEFEELLSGQTT